MSTLDQITKEKQRIGEALARVDAQRDKLTSQLSELEATERVLARYTKGGGKDGRSEDAGDSNESSRSSPATRPPACYCRKTGGRQAQLVDPGGSGPRPGNRQDAAGNRRRMQGSSPEPCRRRHRSAQAGQPHRRARWEALRHTVSGDDATWRGLTPEDKKAPAELNRKRLAGLSEHGAALIGLRICNDPRRAP